MTLVDGCNFAVKVNDIFAWQHISITPGMCTISPPTNLPSPMVQLCVIIQNLRVINHHSTTKLKFKVTLSCSVSAGVFC